jgi:hypothetical protein
VWISLAMPLMPVPGWEKKTQNLNYRDVLIVMISHCRTNVLNGFEPGWHKNAVFPITVRTYVMLKSTFTHPQGEGGRSEFQMCLFFLLFLRKQRKLCHS